MKSDGLLIVISGPSGVGKGTVCSRLLEAEDNLFISVSDTTRNPREGETNGVDYSFISKENFLTNIENNAYLEWAEVYGNFYGTPRAKVEENLNLGKDTLLEIDTRGAFLIKEQFPEGVYIFIAPPSREAQEARLRGRKTDDEATIIKRLQKLDSELEKIPMYDYIVVNEDLDAAVNDVRAILKAEHLKFEHSSVYTKLLSKEK